VQQYTEEFYIPRYLVSQDMSACGFADAVQFADWKAKLDRVWSDVAVLEVDHDSGDVEIGSKAEVRALVRLGYLQPCDLCVQVFYGMLDTIGNIREGQSVDMAIVSEDGDNIYTFVTEHTYDTTGNVGFSVRILPYHDHLHSLFMPQKIVWA